MTQPTSANTPVDTLTSVPPPAPIQVGSNGTPGGYRFDPDQVQSVIQKWQTLLDGVESDIYQAEFIANVRAPGAEPASKTFIAQGAGPSGSTLLEQHKRMRTYIQNYIAALQQASGKIAQSDDDARQAAAKQGQGIV
ncbi:hypothetical protein FHX82_000200 [Amycolatopsis bartoniae]|uniref:PE domain-containing protein n=1 Tax=Amycolatopsis bartoniae TaxID=941986 RepID=A0A8H9IVF7_9PSEU|nr:hypothetical protein [Amycolatopsis bartoniae]MBB2933180.1 hypothetical protein [Amycolatopsis bartoniae]TVT11829.1 hypothetical protein FNH07_00435 [Amycolatopsis bartoniae]GHF57645.1 hypothetical protein GCM10017566_33610 [Amycolatopsis bartoniae]